jgi:putative selenate reductase
VNEKGWPKADEETKESEVENVYVIGDAQSGPSTVVRCIASARSAVEAAIDKVLGPEEEEEDGCGCGHDHDHDHDHECTCEDGCDCDDEDDMTDEERVELENDENEFFAEVAGKKSKILVSKQFGDAEFAATEAARCLECSYLCNKCVDVCPNRATVAIDVRNLAYFARRPFLILHQALSAMSAEM